MQNHEMENKEPAFESLEGGWIRLPKMINCLPSLSSTAKLVYAELINIYRDAKEEHPDNPIIFPRQKTLARYSGVNQSNISRALDDLIKAGLLGKTQLQDTFPKRLRYTLLKIPQHIKTFNTERLNASDDDSYAVAHKRYAVAHKRYANTNNRRPPEASDSKKSDENFGPNKNVLNKNVINQDGSRNVNVTSNDVTQTSTENQQKNTVEPDNNSSNDNHRKNENNQEKTKNKQSRQDDNLETDELNHVENKLEEEKNKKDVTHNSNVNTVGTNNSKQKLNKEEKNNSEAVTKKNNNDKRQKDDFLDRKPPGPSNKFKRNSENNLNKEKEKIKDSNNSNKGKEKNKVKKTNSSSNVKEGQSSAPHDGKTQHDDMHTCSNQARKLTEKIDDELRKNGCQALSRKAQERIPAQLEGYLEKYPYGLIAETVTEVIENLGKSNKPTKRISSAKYFLSTIKNQQEHWSRQNKVRNQIAQSVLKRRKGENNE